MIQQIILVKVNKEKLNDIASKLSVRNYESVSRDELINRLNKIKENPNNLRYRSLHYIPNLGVKK